MIFLSILFNKLELATIIKIIMPITIANKIWKTFLEVANDYHTNMWNLNSKYVWAIFLLGLVLTTQKLQLLVALLGRHWWILFHAYRRHDAFPSPLQSHMGPAQLRCGAFFSFASSSSFPSGFFFLFLPFLFFYLLVKFLVSFSLFT